jgi:hypothetical protein
LIDSLLKGHLVVAKSTTAAAGVVVVVAAAAAAAAATTTMPLTNIGDETNGVDASATAATALTDTNGTSEEVPGAGQKISRSNGSSSVKRKKKRYSRRITLSATARKERAIQQRRDVVLRDKRILRVQDALEHAVVTGSGIRRDNKRQNEYWRDDQRRQRCMMTTREKNSLKRAQQQQGDGNNVNEGEEERPTMSTTTELDHSSSTTISATTTTTKKRKREPTKNMKKEQQEGSWIHAEDIRIYGSHGNRSSEHKRDRPMKPWPVYSKEWKKSPPLDDDDWNLEYGDSIPPNIFYQARLSQAFPFEELGLDLEQAKGQKGVILANGPHARNSLVKETPVRMMSLRSTDVTLSEGDIPRALLLRCWERAIHAASNSMFAPVTPDASHQSSSTTLTATTSESNRQHPSDYTYDNMGKAIMRYNSVHTPLPGMVVQRQCESFGIDVRKPKNTTLTKPSSTTATTTTTLSCPRCCRTFPTSKELLRHYYGHQQLLGCCRHVLRERHLLLVDDILQGHIQSQTDQLVDIILSTHKGRFDTTTKSTVVGDKNEVRTETTTTTTMATSGGKVGNWKDTLQILQQVVDSSKVVDSSTSTLTAMKQSPLTTTTPSVMNMAHRGTMLSREATAVPCSSSASASRSIRHPILQTIQTTETKGSNPLVMNPMILEVARRRLVHRYANLPL